MIQRMKRKQKHLFQLKEKGNVTHTICLCITCCYMFMIENMHKCNATKCMFPALYVVAVEVQLLNV